MAANISAFAQLIFAFVAVYGAWRSWKNGKDIAVIHTATNSMKDELVKEVRSAALAKGTAEGIAIERADPQKPA